MMLFIDNVKDVWDWYSWDGLYFYWFTEINRPKGKATKFHKLEQYSEENELKAVLPHQFLTT